MITAQFPPFPPLVNIALMVAIQAFFGIAYNWAFYRAHLPSWAGVVGGVAITGIILTVFFWGATFMGWQWFILTFAAFIGSGAPMIAGAMRRRELSGDTHRRHPCPTHIARRMEEITAKLRLFISDLQERAAVSITAADLLRWTNWLYELVGMAKVD